MEIKPEEDERIIHIEMERLKDFENHPFKICSDQQMAQLTASIKQYGMTLRTAMPALPVLPENLFSNADEEGDSGNPEALDEPGTGKTKGGRKMSTVIAVANQKGGCSYGKPQIMQGEAGNLCDPAV